MSDPQKQQPGSTPDPASNPQAPQEETPKRAPSPEIPPTRPVPPDRGFVEPQGDVPQTSGDTDRIQQQGETDCGCDQVKGVA